MLKILNNTRSQDLTKKLSLIQDNTLFQILLNDFSTQMDCCANEVHKLVVKEIHRRHKRNQEDYTKLDASILDDVAKISYKTAVKDILTEYVSKDPDKYYELANGMLDMMLDYDLVNWKEIQKRNLK